MRAALTDRNQKEIVAALRQAGASVQILSSVGKGCPDIAIGYLGQTTFAEIKDGLAPKSQRKLTVDQERWHREWRGSVTVIESVADAMRVLGGMATRDTWINKGKNT